jgi:hypothetical protein
MIYNSYLDAGIIWRPSDERNLASVDLISAVQIALNVRITSNPRRQTIRS